MIAIAFILLTFIWGSTWVAIKIGLSDFPPLLFASARFFLATVFLYCILKFKGEKLPKRWDDLYSAVVFGLLNGIAYGLVFWGEQYISSSLTAILNSCLPFFSAIFAYLLVKEPFTSNKIFGLVLGFLGVLLIFGENLGEFSSFKIYGEIAIILSAAVYSFASAHAKKHHNNLNALQAVTVQMAFSTLILFIIALPLETGRTINYSFSSILAFMYLSIFGSAVAFLLYYYLLQKIEVSQLSYVSLITPVIAVLIGIIWMKEPIKWQFIVGLLLTLFGMFVINYSLFKRQKETPC